MNKYSFENRIAVVTGGAQGFGYAISKRIIESGGKVIIWDIDKSAIDKAKKEINSNNFHSQEVDIIDFKNIEKAINDIETKFGKIDIFVNNAGMTGMNAKVWEYPLDEWKKVIDLNLNATFMRTTYILKSNPT